MEASIILSQNVNEIALSPGVLNAKDRAIATAQQITAVQSIDDVLSATAALADLSALKKTMDAAHKEAKAPYYAITKKLDELKKTYNSDLDEQASRLSAMLGAHQEAERRKAEAARRAAEEKQRRIAEEAARLERARLAEEKKHWDENGTGTSELSSDLMDIRQAAAEEIAQARVDALAAAAPALAPAGTSLRVDWDIEVLDVHALYASNPTLCKLDADKTAIKNLLKKGFPCPAGIKATPKVSASVRAKSYNPQDLADSNDY